VDTGRTLELIRQELAFILEDSRAEIVELNLRQTGGNVLLQLLVDKEGGINIDECGLINRRLGDIIEQKALIVGSYLLEVSSPGLDRNLKTKRDFERILGKKVDIWLSAPKDGRPCLPAGRTFINGKIKKVDEKEVLVETAKAGDIPVAYSAISKAVLTLQI